MLNNAVGLMVEYGLAVRREKLGLALAFGSSDTDVRTRLFEVRRSFAVPVCALARARARTRTRAGPGRIDRIAAQR
jgi:Uri superfamily endonuclease